MKWKRKSRANPALQKATETPYRCKSGACKPGKDEPPLSAPDHVYKAWAAQKERTHDVEQCPTCGLNTIWVEKTNG